MEDHSQWLPLGLGLESLGISQDKWERLVDAGLVNDAPFKEGTNFRVIDSARFERLRQILAIEIWLQNKRPRPQTTAFWLAAMGQEVAQPELVLSHVQSVTVSYARVLARMATRYGGRKNKPPFSSEVASAKIGRGIGRRIAATVSVKPEKRSFLREIAVALISGLFARLFGTGPHPFIDRALLKLCAFFAKDAESKNVLREVLAEGLAAMRGFCIDPRFGDNVVLLAVNEIESDEPSRAAFFARVAAMFVAGLGSKFPIFIRPEESKWMTKQDVTFFRRHFTPAIAGILMAMRNDPFCKKMLAEIESGSSEIASAEFEKVAMVGGELSRRVGG